MSIEIMAKCLNVFTFAEREERGERERWNKYTFHQYTNMFALFYKYTNCDISFIFLDNRHLSLTST